MTKSKTNLVIEINVKCPHCKRRLTMQLDIECPLECLQCGYAMCIEGFQVLHGE